MPRLDGPYVPVYSPVCTLCTHLLDIVERRCVAFQGPIPGAIWRGTNPHTKPYRGDHSVRFAERPEPRPR